MAIAFYLFLFFASSVQGSVLFRFPVSPSNSFSWSDCAGSSAPAHLTQLSVRPDPLVLPGDIIFNVAGGTTVNATSPLKTSLSIKKKEVIFWVPIPCIDGIGSCDYDDLCAVINKYLPPEEPCPTFFVINNVPCRCPIPQGSYVIPTSTFYIPKDPLPSWLADGQYKVKLQVEKDGNQFFCLQLSLSISSSSIYTLYKEVYFNFV